MDCAVNWMLHVNNIEKNSFVLYKASQKSPFICESIPKQIGLFFIFRHESHLSRFMRTVLDLSYQRPLVYVAN